MFCIVANCIPLLIQQNVNGSDFFNRSWAEFKVGFNDSRGNYWLGNDLLSQLTLSRRYKLRFDLQARDNHTWYYVEYSLFLVYGESRNYELLVSGYSGNAGDVFRHHSGAMFTTYDRDNDPWKSSISNDNCAVLEGGGFWYSRCGGCLVNARSVSWYLLPTGAHHLQSTRMWLMC